MHGLAPSVVRASAQRAANLRRRFELDRFRNSHAAIHVLVADGKMTPPPLSPVWTCDDGVS